jgi:hypothetical protein
VFVVAVVLCEGFLEDRTVDGFVFSDFSVQCSVGVSVLLKWEVVVDNDCVRDAKGVELESVDTGSAHIFIQEDFLEAA